MCVLIPQGVVGKIVAYIQVQNTKHNTSRFIIPSAIFGRSLEGETAVKSAGSNYFVDRVCRCVTVLTVLRICLKH